MDDQRVGSVLRAIRRHRRWRQADVARRAGVSQATISRVERGHIGRLSVGAVRAVAAAMEVRLDLTPRWHGGEIDRLLDARHAALAGAVSHELAAARWLVTAEASFSIYGERGSIDLLAWHAPTRALLVVEVKTDVVDLQDLLSTVDRKQRLAARIAAERGWLGASGVSVWVVVSEGRTNRRRLAAHRALLRTAYPVDGRTIGAWLRAPRAPVAALSFMTGLHPVHARPSSRANIRVSRPRGTRVEHESQAGRPSEAVRSSRDRA